MRVVVRTFTVLLATYYIIGTTANMRDVKEIKSKIELEIEVNKIKNNIIQKLRNNGLQVDLPQIGPITPDSTSSRIITDVNAISTPQPSQKNSRGSNIMPSPVVEPNGFSTDVPPLAKPKSKPLIVIGEPRSKSKKDKCLNFRFGKYMKDDTIVPIRMNLWVYLRVQKNRKKKKPLSVLDKEGRVGEKQEQKIKSQDHPRVKRMTKKLKKRNKKRKGKKRKNRKNKKGRTVKIFVSDENKRLVIMRMRVKKTDWYMLELPISQFPSVINHNYTRTLCIKCKRCNKKIKIDLRSKRLLADPTVPFIHIEPLHSLPQSIYRQNKRRRRHVMLPKEPTVPAPCCREDIHTIYVAKDFPNVLHPRSINISICKHLPRDVIARDSNNRPLLSQQNNSISNHVSLHSRSRFQCEIESMESLTLTFVDRLLNVKQLTIPDLLPTGCRCRYRPG